MSSFFFYLFSSPTPFKNPPSLLVFSPPLCSLSLSLSLKNKPSAKTKASVFHSSMESLVSRRPCFIDEEDEGLAEMEAGFSGTTQVQQHPCFSRPMCYSNRKMGSNSSCLSPRSGRFVWDARFEEPQPHFLEACFLCKKPLGDNRDIFMYRGDTPFCSEECREEQIEADEAKEKNWSLSSSMKALRKREQRKSSSAKEYSFRPGTVVAA